MSGGRCATNQLVTHILGAQIGGKFDTEGAAYSAGWRSPALRGESTGPVSNSTPNFAPISHGEIQYAQQSLLNARGKEDYGGAHNCDGRY